MIPCSLCVVSVHTSQYFRVFLVCPFVHNVFASTQTQSAHCDTEKERERERERKLHLLKEVFKISINLT